MEDITATIDYKVDTLDDCLVLCNANSLQIGNTEAPCWVAHMFSPIAKVCRLIYRYENLTSTYFDIHTTGASQWDSLFVKKCPCKYLRDRQFNLKEGNYCFFWRTNSVRWTFFSVSDMSRNKYSECTFLFFL